MVSRAGWFHLDICRTNQAHTGLVGGREEERLLMSR